MHADIAEIVTHLVTAAVMGTAFWWRVESPEKKATPERISVLAATAVGTLWNLGSAVAKLLGKI
jgi:hypothetical protein